MGVGVSTITGGGVGMGVAVGLGVVLWQLGLLDFAGRELPGHLGFSVLVPLDWQTTYGSPCTLDIQFSNGAGENLSRIAIGGGTCTPDSLGQAGTTVCTMPVTCTGRGDRFEYDVIALYTRNATGEVFQSAGTIWGSVS